MSKIIWLFLPNLRLEMNKVVPRGGFSLLISTSRFEPPSEGREPPMLDLTQNRLATLPRQHYRLNEYILNVKD